MGEFLISVIVPAYNVEKYIGKCIDSIINQTYKNLEIIIIDEGSTDSTPQICDEYAEKDRRIIVIHQENGGLSAARNAGMDIAEGKYLAFVDSDDYIYPDMFFEMEKAAEENGLDVVKSNFVRCTQDGKEESRADDTGSLTVFTPEEAFENFLTEPYSMRKKFKVCVCDALYLRERIKNLRFPEGHLYEDGYYTPTVLLNSKKPGHIDTSFYAYRVNKSSIMGSGISDKSLKSIDDWENIFNQTKEKMPQFCSLAAKRWIEKLLRVYNILIFDDSLDRDNLCKEHIRNKIKKNYRYFMSVTASKRTKLELTLIRNISWQKYKKIKNRVKKQRSVRNH